MPTKQEYEVVIKSELLNLTNQIEELEKLNSQYHEKMIRLKAGNAPNGTGRSLEILKAKISALEKNKAKTLEAYKASIEQSIDDNQPNAKEQRRLKLAEGMLGLAKKQLSFADASSNAATRARHGNIHDPIKTDIWQNCKLRQIDAAEQVKEAEKEVSAAKNELNPQPHQQKSTQPQNAVSQAIRNTIQKDARSQMQTLRNQDPDKQVNESNATTPYLKRSSM